jgi:hypothetical protein
MVVGPGGRRSGWPAPQQSSDDEGDQQQGVGAMVEQPAKVMRIGTMIKQSTRCGRPPRRLGAAAHICPELEERAWRPSCATS